MGRRARIVISIVCLQLASAPLAAQDPPAPETVVTPEALQAAAVEMTQEAAEMAQPLPPGEVKKLQALVIQVVGRAQWRPDADAPWKVTKVDDLLDAGARIRTGGKSSMTLRVGLNATLLVGSRTRATLPEIAKIGSELKTSMGLERGRLDFKVDRIGLTNDFRVVTPSMTLAVRGTGGAVRYGGLGGTEVVGAQYNRMLAIELKYFLSTYLQYLSGKAQSSDTFQNPVFNALFQTIGPPALITRSAGVEDIIDRLSTSIGIDRDLLEQRRIEFGVFGTKSTIEELEDTDDRVDPFIEALVTALCLPDTTGGSMVSAFMSDYFTPELQNSFKFVDFQALAIAETEMELICSNFDIGIYDSNQAFALMASEISRFCETYDVVGSLSHDLCLQDFADALIQFSGPGE